MMEDPIERFDYVLNLCIDKMPVLYVTLSHLTSKLLVILHISCNTTHQVCYNFQGVVATTSHWNADPTMHCHIQVTGYIYNEC